MPKGGTLINTARLGVIDEEGLMKMFAERDDFAYLSDISPGCKDDIVSTYSSRGPTLLDHYGLPPAEGMVGRSIFAD